MNNEKVLMVPSGIDKLKLTNIVEKYCNKNRIHFDKNALTTYPLESDKGAGGLVEKMPYGSNVFIENLSVLGKSTFNILKIIKEFRLRKITLHIIDDELSFNLNNSTLFAALESLYALELSRVKHRTLVAKETREKKNVKLGRKRGSTSKSKYDPHKKRILYLHKQGVPNTKIVKDIGLGTAQSLGKYIKQVNEAKKSKEKKKGTYLLSEEDLGNIGFN